MLGAIETAQQHVGTLPLDEFLSEKMTIDAVLYELMVLGEAENPA